MRISVRLNSPYDIDLISLLYRDDYDLRKEMRNALYAYVRGEDREIRVPKSFREVDYTHQNPHFLDLNIYDQDRDVIAFYESIRRSYRNSFLKHIFRHMCEDLYLLPENKVKAASTPNLKKNHTAHRKKRKSEAIPAPSGNEPLDMEKTASVIEKEVPRAPLDGATNANNTVTEHDTNDIDSPAALLKELF